MKFQNIINDVIGVRNPYGLIQKAGKTPRQKFRNKSRNKSLKNKSIQNNIYIYNIYKWL